MTPSAPIAFAGVDGRLQARRSTSRGSSGRARRGCRGRARGRRRRRSRARRAWRGTPRSPPAEWFVGRHMRGLCVNTWTQSPPIAAMRSIAVSMPPADETCAPNSTAAYDRERHVRESPHGAEPDRLPPHRRRAHVPLQLALRAPAGRRVPAPHREHRHEPRGRRGGRPDPGVAALGRHRLGRAGDLPARHRRDARASSRDELVAKGKAYEDEGAIRFRQPKEGTVSWVDAVRGEIEFRNEQLADLVIVRSDGRPTYNFVSPVDDILDGITHVIRAEDHVSNTPTPDQHPARARRRPAGVRARPEHQRRRRQEAVEAARRRVGRRVPRRRLPAGGADELPRAARLELRRQDDDHVAARADRAVLARARRAEPGDASTTRSSTG